MSEVKNAGAFSAVTPDIELPPGIACVQCGHPELTLVRKDPKGSNHRLRCLGCSFTFDQSMAEAAKQLGAIPDASSAAALADAVDPETETVAAPELRQPIVSRSGEIDTITKLIDTLPRTPKYVFMSKDRKNFEFCGSKQFKKTALKWAQRGKYDLFELEPKKMDVKVNLG